MSQIGRDEKPHWQFMMNVSSILFAFAALPASAPNSFDPCLFPSQSARLGFAAAIARVSRAAHIFRLPCSHALPTAECVAAVKIAGGSREYLVASLARFAHLICGPAWKTSANVSAGQRAENLNPTAALNGNGADPTKSRLSRSVACCHVTGGVAILRSFSHAAVAQFLPASVAFHPGIVVQCVAFFKLGIEKDPAHFKTACERIERELDGKLL